MNPTSPIGFLDHADTIPARAGYKHDLEEEVDGVRVVQEIADLLDREEAWSHGARRRRDPVRPSA